MRFTLIFELFVRPVVSDEHLIGYFKRSIEAILASYYPFIHFYINAMTVFMR